MPPFTDNSLLQIALYFAILFFCMMPLGSYMAKVYMGRPIFLQRLLWPVERLLYRAAGIAPEEEMTWRAYATAFLAFSFGSFALLYLILLLQGVLPFNPEHFPGLTPDLAFNVAASFVTNTNWQSYSGESSMSYFSQFAGLTVQHFVSAAAGMAVLAALIRGLTRKNTDRIGNFWADMVKSALYILLPLALIWTVILGSQGVVQTFDPYVSYHPLERTGFRIQDSANNISSPESRTPNPGPSLIAVGPAASQISIKQIGTNGGGFYSTNSAHPFENPTAISNFFEMLAILLIPAALCYTFGIMVGDRRQGWALLIAKMVILLPLLFVCLHFEQAGNPKFAPLNIDQAASDLQPGGNMEGKETRFGITSSVLWATATTSASNGSVNAMHDSFTPLGGLVPMFMMQFGEVIFGGAGSGLYGMLVYVMITVFIAGLMVGRTPEYLGKKIQAFEIKMASLFILITPMVALIGVAVACLTAAGRAGMFNPGAQGFSEILYAFTSAANNNGSAFAGLNANTPFYNTALGLAMLFGRFWVIVPVLAIAGSLAEKNAVPPSAGTLPTHAPLFIAFLVGTVVLVGVLTYAAADALGPVAEYLNMMKQP